MAGYGRSSKPPASPSRNHEEYSKRELADDLVQVMTHLNFERFSILAHDRGARVAHRLLLDHGERVGRCVLLDIAPTLWMYEGTDMAFVCLSFFVLFLHSLWEGGFRTLNIVVESPYLPHDLSPHHLFQTSTGEILFLTQILDYRTNTQATGYWHWFFLIQPSPQTEEFILSNPRAYWAMLGSRASHTGVKWSEEDVERYQEGYFTKEGIHAVSPDSSILSRA
jgi:pimeloyl-ACP methyl ester carboxylesterase